MLIECTIASWKPTMNISAIHRTESRLRVDGTCRGFIYPTMCSKRCTTLMQSGCLTVPTRCLADSGTVRRCNKSAYGTAVVVGTPAQLDDENTVPAPIHPCRFPY